VILKAFETAVPLVGTMVYGMVEVMVVQMVVLMVGL
jgi:hypothetical protein